MKKTILILLLILAGLNTIILAGNRNVIVQISVKGSDGLLQYPGECCAPFTEADLIWELCHLDKMPECVAYPGDHGINSSFNNTQGSVGKALSLRFDLNVFEKCGGHIPGDNIVLTMTICKPGHPFDGMSTQCHFVVQDKGAFSFIGENGVVFDVSAK